MQENQEYEKTHKQSKEEPPLIHFPKESEATRVPHLPLPLLPQLLAPLLKLLVVVSCSL